ncbi:MAG: glycoside hydrolase N-terminal domain-containing protein [Verrucomicrobiota bacterium]
MAPTPSARTSPTWTAHCSNDAAILRWEDAFVTGNGRMGAMLFGNPTNETLVANHCRLFLPGTKLHKVFKLVSG